MKILKLVLLYVVLVPVAFLIDSIVFLCYQVSSFLTRLENKFEKLVNWCKE